MEDFDFSWLEKEWVVGRAEQINKQLQKRYLHLSQNRTPERLQEIVETQEVPDSLRGDVTAQTLAPS
jgi:hypothetical protein